MYTPSPIALNMGVGFDVVLMGAVHITGQRILLVSPMKLIQCISPNFLSFCFLKTKKIN